MGADTAAGPLQLQNALATSTSPYLRSHRKNPVAWQEWSPKTIELARAHRRMIFLSVGYSACHWCHVMEKESFSSPEVANVLNESFIPIKVDRESRPDLDEIYMNFVTATTGSGGWPLSLFLTPDLQPIFGGTYWPGPTSNVKIPTDADNEDRPVNFLEILHKMVDVWTNEQERCIRSAADITRQLQQFAAEGSHSHAAVHVKGDTADDSDPTEPLELDLLDDALAHFALKYDRENGGFSDAPKFPLPVNLQFLLRLGASISFDDRRSTPTRFGFPGPVPGILGRQSCATAASIALHTLRVMSRSGLRDHLGHGFHRYSVTPDWNVPHFEKMLYDNAQLLGVYCDAWALGRNPEILGTIYDLVEYFTDPTSPIVRADGGWYSSEDADSRPSPNSVEDKREGAFYVWTQKEFQSILGDRDASILARHFGVRPDGNVPAQYDVHDEFLNHNTLFIHATPSTLAKEFGLKEEEIVRVIKAGRVKLSEYRNSQRERPEVDTKIITSWNALTINALTRAASTLLTIDTSRAARCREAAQRGMAFIQKEMFDSESRRLTRIHNPAAPADDAARDLAFIDDYAYLIKAAISVYDLTFETKHLEFALQLQATLDDNYLAHTSGGYLQSAKPPPSSSAATTPSEPNGSTATPTSTSAERNPISEQILNLKPGTDSTVPSPNGIIATNLLYLSAYVSTAPELGSFRAAGLDRRYAQQARRTMDAFAVEIIQHPFLYVTLLAAVVMNTLTVHALVAPGDMSLDEIQARGLRGFSRTVVRGGAKQEKVMVCSKDGVCRPINDGELDALDDDDDDEEVPVPVQVPVTAKTGSDGTGEVDANGGAKTSL